MVAVARNGKECTRRELVANCFAWRPLPRAFKLTRFRIQPIRKKHTDCVFLSSSCVPLDPACEPLDQARLHQSGRSTWIVCFFSSACESFDQACEPLDQASRVKPSMVQFVHEVHLVFVVALSVGQMMIYPFLS